MDYMHEANAIAAALRRGAPAKAAPVRRGAQGMTVRTEQVLAFMRAFFADNDQLPPASAIARHFGWASVESAHWHVRRLLRMGVIEPNAVGRWRFARSVR